MPPETLLSAIDALLLLCRARPKAHDSLAAHAAHAAPVAPTRHRYEWLGSAAPCVVSPTEWRQCTATIAIDPTRKGHALDCNIVVGHRAGVLYMDDVTVVQVMAS